MILWSGYHSCYVAVRGDTPAARGVSLGQHLCYQHTPVDDCKDRALDSKPLILRLPRWQNSESGRLFPKQSQEKRNESGG